MHPSQSVRCLLFAALHGVLARNARQLNVLSILAGCRYDVNVTPDKRKVMLHSEKAILDALKEVGHIGC